MSVSQPNHLLVPVDLSESSRAGLLGASEIARRFDARITVLHVEVATAAFTEALAGTGLLEEAEEAGRRHREDLKARVEQFARESLGEASPVPVVVTDAIFVSDAVVEYADEHDVDWICMGATGHRAPGQIALGSSVAEVVRRSRQPVLILRPREEEGARPVLGDLERILVAVDLGEGSRDLVELGAVLASPAGELFVLHVVESPMERGLYGKPLAVPAEDMKAVIEWCEVAIGKLAEGVEEPVLKPPLVRAGRPGAQTLAAVEEIAPSLTIVGTHGRHGLDRLALGSVAERVARRATGPVLVVPTHPVESEA